MKLTPGGRRFKEIWINVGSPAFDRKPLRNSSSLVPTVTAQKLLQALEQIAIRDSKMRDKIKGRETCKSGWLMNGIFK